jgi:RimJ/RimL family protein N-acetyltransferase
LLLRRPRTGDLGYWLIARARGRGTARVALGLLVGWALEQPALAAIEAFVDERNTRSRNLLERLGFELIGTRRHRVNEIDDELAVYRRTAPGVRNHHVRASEA